MGISFRKAIFERAAGALAGQRGTTFKKGVLSEMWWVLLQKKSDG